MRVYWSAVLVTDLSKLLFFGICALCVLFFSVVGLHASLQDIELSRTWMVLRQYTVYTYS